MKVQITVVFERDCLDQKNNDALIDELKELINLFDGSEPVISVVEIK